MREVVPGAPMLVRSGFNVSRMAVVYGTLLVLAFDIGQPQHLHQRDPPDEWCGQLDLRMVAKLSNGSAATLTAGDLQVSFERGVADVSSLTSFADLHGEDGKTDILFVVPPFSDFGSTSDVNGIVKTLAHAESFQFRSSVLGPSGHASSYTNDLAELDKQLNSAVKASYSGHGLSQWELAERTAFIQLRNLPGRHVIVRLFRTRGVPQAEKRVFMLDSTLDVLASLDIAVVYRLLKPVNLSSSIPGGDASTQASISGEVPDSHGVRQTEQLRTATQSQAELWAQQHYWDTSTAGGAASSTMELMHLLIKDNASSYKLVVRPHFSCKDSGLQTVKVESSRTGARIFAPQAVPMTPVSVSAQP